MSPNYPNIHPEILAHAIRAGVWVPADPNVVADIVRHPDGSVTDSMGRNLDGMAKVEQMAAALQNGETIDDVFGPVTSSTDQGTTTDRITLQPHPDVNEEGRLLLQALLDGENIPESELPKAEEALAQLRANYLLEARALEKERKDLEESKAELAEMTALVDAHVKKVNDAIRNAKKD